MITTEQQRAFADDLHHLANMVENNPMLAQALYGQLAANRLLLPVAHVENPAATMQSLVRLGLSAGLVIEKSYDDHYGNVDLKFPSGLTLHVYAQREQVCTRRVVGTREVVKEIPDPTITVPTVTVTETVEDVEWDCLPLLAPRTREEQMADAASDGFIDNYDPDLDAPGADDYLADVTE